MKKLPLRIRWLIGPLAVVTLTQCDRDEPVPITAPAVDSEQGSPLGSAFPLSPAELVLNGQSTSSGTVLVGAGNIARCDRSNDDATAALLDDIPGTVFTLGDNAYPYGTAADFDCYDASWGRHKERTRPALGEVDYKTSDATPYFNYFGTAAGEPGKGYYSYDLGNWHVVVLNSEISYSTGSAQEQWLRSDLAANIKRCTVAYWHEPLFWSGTNRNYDESIKPLWDVLYEAGADVVVNAHLRWYERFAPQTPDGVRDDENGIRQFIVGTGGYSVSHSFGTPLANSEARIQGTFGVLKLTLGESGYTWEFVPKAGSSATDSGSGTCHGASGEPPPPPPANQAPTADAGGPYSGTEGAAIAFDGSASSDPDGDALSYAWDFGDGTTGSGATPSHAYADNATYSVVLSVSDANGASGAPGTTTVTVANLAPSVDAGADTAIGEGESFDLSATFSDPGAQDAPWSYSIDWGNGSAPANGSKSSPSSAITASHTYALAGSYTVRVTVTDKDGSEGADERNVSVTAAPPPPPPPPPPPGSGAVVFVGAGDIASCSTGGDENTAALLDDIPGTVFTLGDNAYPSGTAADYNNCYDPSWGRHKDRTYAALGDEDYETGTANPAWDYFGDRAGPRGKGYYSFDLGEWHIIVLNTEIPHSAGTEQDQWLQADLAASTKQCTIAIFHQPYFYGAKTDSDQRIFWDRLYAAGVEIVMNGHQHYYERLAPQTPDGTLDPNGGIRQFIVGTGGKSVHTVRTPASNSEAAGSRVRGVLKLTLDAGSYTWEFVPVPGNTFTDSGSKMCH